MKHAAMVAMIAVAGCGYRPASSFRFGADWTDEEKQVIRAQVDEWHAVFPGEEMAEFIEDGDVPIVITNDLPGDDTKSFGVTSFSWDTVAVIGILNRREVDGPNWLNRLAMTSSHEFGHAFSGRGDHIANCNVMGTGDMWCEPSIPTLYDVQYVIDGM